MSILADWPAKSPLPDSDVEHPALYHMLDVAAVADVLIEPFAWATDVKQAFVALVALHDLGKFSESFRGMLRGEGGGTPSHWKLTEVLLRDSDSILKDWMGGTLIVRRVLYAAVAGHHGSPPQINYRVERRVTECREAIGLGADVIPEVLNTLCQLWPEASLEDMDNEEAIRFSWWLPGFCTAADWIGSNTDWFPPMAPELDPVLYWTKVRPIARKAVEAIGLGGTRARDEALFKFALRPLQTACLSVPLPEGPSLVILEAETGAGKTEAALLLAQRMALAGKGRGIFFALPTMATADAMFGRIEQTAGRMFDRPTLTLAHGRAGLSVPFRDVVSKGSRTGEDVTDDEVTSSDWLASDNRRALLADIGVGTIDQALLSVLPVRFQTLRHYGLSSKILIVDEVHEMGEPYIAKELVALLKMHCAMGGSAILLTATLPLRWRKELLETYGGVSDSRAYPAITVAGGEAVTEFAADDRPQKGVVTVERIGSLEEAVQYLVSCAAKGAACVWVRNAVDDAIAAVNALREEGVEAHLLHARFALCDRKRLEKEVLSRVGRDGTGRKGFVLVSTQIVEASLDLDFDVMVSDLAPIGSLIQRVGRLWRHMDLRPAEGRPVPAPVVKILSPDPEVIEDERWLRQTLEKGGWVYPLPDMWKTASVLFRSGKIEAPDGLRALIEAVHGEEAEPVPPVLDQAEAERWGKDNAASNLAQQNIVCLSDGYRKAGKGADDARYPTRLGDETRVLVLARRTDQGLVPWARTDDETMSETALWRLSEVSVRCRWLEGCDLPDQDTPEIQAVKKRWPKWRQAASTICPVQQPGGGICEGLQYDPSVGLLHCR